MIDILTVDIYTIDYEFTHVRKYIYEQGIPADRSQETPLRICPAEGCKTKMTTMNSVVCSECKSKAGWGWP